MKRRPHISMTFSTRTNGQIGRQSEKNSIKNKSRIGLCSIEIGLDGVHLSVF